MKQVPRKRPGGQTWKTFLRNHAAGVWACDFLQVTDLFFRPLFAFFIIELQSRKVIHVNVTRSPTDPWVARTATGGHAVWANPNISDPGY
jgi:putative transposase